jgi:hypothetical protein
MAGLPEVIGLLYRADWTRLSLSAELRSETGREPLPRPSRERWYRAWPGQGQDNGRYVGRGALLIGPGGRWRLECPVPGRGAEGGAAEGNDGERGWSWRPPEMVPPPPPSSRFGEDLKETMRQKFSGPGWDAADAAAGALGALIRHVPHRPGHGAAGEQPEAMPSPDPPPLGPADGSPPPDEVLDLLYRSGEPRDFGATARQWHDLAVVAAWVPERARAAGRGGRASLLDAMTSDEKVRRMDTRLRVSGPDRYRLEFGPRPGRNAPKTIACDGERRWRVYQDRIVVGPADPLAGHIAFMADSC